MLNLSQKSDLIMDKRPLHSMKIMGTPRSGRVLARWIMGIMIVVILAMFLPWQQNVRGNGEVTTFNPANRPQTVETAIAGRIENWMVREGDQVQKGDTIMVISEIKDKFFDPNLVGRLGEQVDAKESSVTSKVDKADALRDQIQALESEFNFKLEQAKNKVEQTRLKVISDSMDLEAEKTNLDIAQQQYERQENLYEQGLKSLTELETRRMKLQETTAKKISAENKLLASRNEFLNANIELTRLSAEFREKRSK
ncbi:MAG: biotin/lipoyl-binding protein, partial [Cyclobacteriaceae bacterium]